jgi:hypothetical protein
LQTEIRNAVSGAATRLGRSNDMKINFFRPLHYVTENAGRQNNVTKQHPLNRVWFDDIVVSTEYVGPIKK